MARDGVFGCIECGERYSAPPKGNICTSCSAAKVIDLTSAQGQAIAAALGAGSGSGRRLSRDLVAAAVIIAVIIGGVSWLIWAGSRRRDERAARRQQLKGVRFVTEQTETETWSDVLSSYVQEIGERADAAGTCIAADKYERRRAVPEGITLRWVIAEDGAVRDAAVRKSELPELFEPCILHSIATEPFAAPPTGSPLTVDVTCRAHALWDAGWGLICPPVFAVLSPAEDPGR